MSHHETSRRSLHQALPELRAHVLRTLQRRGLPAEQAEDISQDVLLAAIELARRGGSRVPLDTEGWRRYLLRMASNDVIDSWRCQRRRPRLRSFDPDWHDPTDGEANPAEQHETREGNRALWDCVDELPELERTICRHYATGAGTLPGIARHLGLPEHRVRRAFARGVARLRRALVSRGHLEARPA